MKNNSLSKSLTRYAAIQALYNLDYSKNLNEVKKNLTSNKGFFVDSNYELNFKKTKMNKVFFSDILNYIEKEKDKIDELIKSYLVSEWRLDRIPKVQLAILRVAVLSEVITSGPPSLMLTPANMLAAEPSVSSSSLSVPV